jgi:general secretion pathway protein A
MYDNHFGLKETPFTIAPDPRFLYMSERHREALAHLVYGFETDGGFVLLTGEVGTGKTTISRCLLEQLPDNSNVAVVLNPKINGLELLATICDELHIDYPKENTSVKTFIDLINQNLLETNSQGKKTVVIVEEAQNLEMEVMELLRLLTNLETNQRKLLQIIMIGQPELLQVLSRPELRQLEQRITARYHLLPLSQKDAMDYVKHRLEVAGLKEPVFSFSLLKKVYKYTEGIPRKINLLCDRAMLGAYVQNQKTIDKKILARAAREVFGDAKHHQVRKPFWSKGKVVSFVALLILATGGYAAYHFRSNVSDLIASFSLPGNNEVQPAVIEQAGNSSENPAEEMSSFFVALDEESVDIKKQAAFATLFSQWNEPLSEVSLSDPCDVATNKGLACLAKVGNLNTLKQMDRPAILKFLNGRNEPVYATLVSLNAGQATLRIGNKDFNVPLSDLESRWFGDYTILWRMPPAFTGAIKLGTSGDDVQWLASNLAAIAGQEVPGIVSYDTRLIRAVKNFQKQEGLSSDGIAGVQTLIQINTVVDKSVPRLSGGSNKSGSANKQSATMEELQSAIQLALVGQP